MAAALTTMSLYDGTAPPVFSTAALSCARSSTAASMSTSVLIVNSGTVALDSAMRRAMTCWVRVSSWTVTSPLAVPVSAAAGAAGGGAASASGSGAAGTAGAGVSAGGAAGAAPEAAASTSALTIRPPGPVPCSVVRSIPCSRAMRRATGEAFGRPPLPSDGGAAGAGAAAAARAAGAAAGGSAVAAGAAGAGASLGEPFPDASACCAASAGASAAAPSPAGASPPAPMRAMTWPMGSVSPSWATIDSAPAVSAS